MNDRHTLLLTTPEGVRFPLRLAGPGQRCLALGMDALLIVAMISVASRLLGLLNRSLLAAAITLATGFLLHLVYAMTLEWFWRGQTVGKRLFHLRVLDAQGLPLTPAQVIIRNLMRLVDALPAAYLVGGAAAALSARRQRCGDWIASTVVADETANLAAPTPATAPASAGKYNSLLGWPSPALRLRHRARAADAQFLLALLQRRDRLRPADRLRLFRATRAYWNTRAQFPEEATATLSDEQYLRDVAALLQAPTLAPHQPAR